LAVPGLQRSRLSGQVGAESGQAQYRHNHHSCIIADVVTEPELAHRVLQRVPGLP
jgi:hypothetical protein